MLVGLLVPLVVVEAIVRDDLVWRGVSIVVTLALISTLLWRRTHPLAAVTVAFATVAVVDIASLVADVYWEGLGTAVFLLLLPYSLVRWGAGREVVIGMSVVFIPVVLSAFDPVPASDLVGGGLVVLLAAAIGAAVRYQDNARRRGMEQVKLREREQLARELHDTVAHHVSAIAIHAQAGRVLAASSPNAALDALAVIEEEASRTLEEMRSMVGTLRRNGEPEYSPLRGASDIVHLANSPGDQPHVDVELVGDLDRLRPSIDAALYRLAQESITNAIRHARHATHIRVTVDSGDDCVQLTVRDDGDAAPGQRIASGYGLIGMTERAALLGGTLDAGPDRDADRGWTVRAVLPKRAGSS